jgi:hypothetical protein
MSLEIFWYGVYFGWVGGMNGFFLGKNYLNVLGLIQGFLVKG